MRNKDMTGHFVDTTEQLMTTPLFKRRKFHGRPSSTGNR